MKIHIIKPIVASVFILTIFLPLLSGCSSGASTGSHSDLAMASMDSMPEKVKAAPVSVQQAYQFATANPDVLKKIPCYCGCGAMGHTSNYACYISDVDAQGKVSFDTHALGCSICVDITQDTMRLLKSGKSIPQIKDTIDQTYSQYGSSNIP